MASRSLALSLVAGGVFLAAALGVILWVNSVRAGASPPQPLNFSHRAHVEKQIDCSFCHGYYDSHAAAGIPPLSLCVSCHSGIELDDPNARKIFDYASQGREIPWVRLYELPGYNVFSHKWHVRAGIECRECHGNIGESERPVRHMKYKMAWCVDCHTEKQASTDCLTCHR